MELILALTKRKEKDIAYKQGFVLKSLDIYFFILI